jgi:hypothetical protein
MTLAKPVSFPSVHPSPPLNRVRPVPARPASVASNDPADRDRLLAEANQLQEEARLSALAGDLAASAQLILQALDCERRSGGLGPQVLQLIKPR